MNNVIPFHNSSPLSQDLIKKEILKKLNNIGTKFLGDTPSHRFASYLENIVKKIRDGKINSLYLYNLIPEINIILCSLHDEFLKEEDDDIQ